MQTGLPEVPHRPRNINQVDALRCASNFAALAPNSAPLRYLNDMGGMLHQHKTGRPALLRVPAKHGAWVCYRRIVRVHVHAREAKRQPTLTPCIYAHTLRLQHACFPAAYQTETYP